MESLYKKLREDYSKLVESYSLLLDSMKLLVKVEKENFSKDIEIATLRKYKEALEFLAKHYDMKVDPTSYDSDIMLLAFKIMDGARDYHTNKNNKEKTK